MAEKLILLIPELVLLAGAVVAAILGLSPRKRVRDGLPAVTVGFLAAGLVATLIFNSPARLADLERPLLMPGLLPYVKVLACAIGIVLAMTSAGIIDRKLESDVAAGRTGFDPLRSSRGEFHAFFLLSIIGVMLCAGANDLIWLFVSLELVSLPTYIMVAVSRSSPKAQEASMKYFFLGALSAAIFLYGFALLYGSTGTIILTEMQAAFAEQKIASGGSINVLGTAGFVLTILGLAYKIAAAPMHFYAADVYEGAASPVTAFLGFVPKLAGFVALALLLGTAGWATPLEGAFAGETAGLPQPVVTTLWMVAVLTMTLGNVGALLQRSVKRMLAYSSIAHSGYMVIGLIAGPGLGLNAVLFYMLVYGLMNTGAFAVLAGLERQGREIETREDLAGLRHRHPAMAVAMALCAGSLLGFPPLLGFIAKLVLFIAGVQSGQIALVVIAGLNSAISAWYYLSLVALPILSGTTPRSETVERSPVIWPRVAAIGTAGLVTVLPLVASPLLDAAAVTGEEAMPAGDASAAPSVDDGMTAGDDAGADAAASQAAGSDPTEA